MIPETENPQEAKSVWVSLRGMLMLIRVDILRRVHNVGFIAGRLNYDDRYSHLFFCNNNSI